MKSVIATLLSLIVCIVTLFAAFFAAGYAEKNRIGRTSGLFRTGTLDYQKALDVLESRSSHPDPALFAAARPATMAFDQAEMLLRIVDRDRDVYTFLLGALTASAFFLAAILVGCVIRLVLRQRGTVRPPRPVPTRA